mmetsp:Transcript_84995/g.245449  ORF Transcript_84995/g.245449 Transcript_84995/m.245449 type:complete len:172 (+) Transcript_84995:51-566(+)
MAPVDDACSAAIGSAAFAAVDCASLVRFSAGECVGVCELFSASDPAEDAVSVRRMLAQRLLKRCMTHERPIALTQAGAATLDACFELLGVQAEAGWTRSDKIRRLLAVTDELRAKGACQVEVAAEAVPPEEIVESDLDKASLAVALLPRTAAPTSASFARSKWSCMPSLWA